MRSRRALVLSAIVVPCMLGHAVSVRAQSPSATLSGSDVALACAPFLTIMADQAPTPTVRIIGAPDTVPRGLFGTRDLVVVNGGASSGLQLGQQYSIRRTYAFGRPSKGKIQTIHTTGWLRVVAVNDNTAVAQIEQVCDGVVAGDYLEPFVAPAPSAVSVQNAPGDLDFSSVGRVLFGDQQRRLAVPGDFVILNVGNASLASGARVAVYRDLQSTGVPLAAVGEGVIVSMPNGSLVMRITAARDAVRSGDFVVPRK